MLVYTCDFSPATQASLQTDSIEAAKGRGCAHHCAFFEYDNNFYVSQCMILDAAASRMPGGGQPRVQGNRPKGTVSKRRYLNHQRSLELQLNRKEEELKAEQLLLEWRHERLKVCRGQPSSTTSSPAHCCSLTRALMVLCICYHHYYSFSCSWIW